MSWLSDPIPSLFELVSTPGAFAIVKVALVLSLAWVALRVMPRFSASTRYVVVATALGAALLIPALELALPAWEAIPRPAAATAERPGDATRLGVTNASAERRLAAREGQAAAHAPVAPMSSRRAASWPASGRVIVQAAWLAGVVGLLALLTARLLAMALEVRRAAPVDDPAWTSLVAGARGALGIRQTVELRRRGAGEMPAVWGIRRPVILLPEECEAWSAERRRAVLFHELAHVARGDVLMLTLAHVATALHWFNPLVWSLLRRLAIEREHACDDLALQQGLRPTRYADHLLTTAAAYRNHRSLAPVMAAQSQLEGRVMAILDPRRNRGSVSPRAQIAVVLLAMVAMLPLASLSWAQARPSPGSHGSAPAHTRSEPLARELERLGIATVDVDSLIRGLEADSAWTRAACAQALGATDDPRRIDALLAVANDVDALVREWVVRSLGGVDDPRVVNRLSPLFDDEAADVREWCVRGLGDLADGRVLDAVVRRLDDEAADVREWAVRRLAGSDDDRAQDAILDAFYGERDPEVQEWVVRSLDPAHDSGAVDVLITALDSESSDVREWAVRQLGDTGDGRAVNPLIDMLRDPSAEVREWAVRGLANTGDPRAIVPLRGMLDDPSADVRDWAGRALEEL